MAELPFDMETNIGYEDSMVDALSGLGFTVRSVGHNLEPNPFHFFEIDNPEDATIGFIGKGNDGLWHYRHLGTTHTPNVGYDTWRSALARLINTEIDLRLGLV